jgi:hypothetical protein
MAMKERYRVAKDQLRDVSSTGEREHHGDSIQIVKKPKVSPDRPKSQE